jgi:hypothetical protein
MTTHEVPPQEHSQRAITPPYQSAMRPFHQHPNETAKPAPLASGPHKRWAGKDLPWWKNPRSLSLPSVRCAQDADEPRLSIRENLLSTLSCTALRLSSFLFFSNGRSTMWGLAQAPSTPADTYRSDENYKILTAGLATATSTLQSRRN